MTASALKAPLIRTLVLSVKDGLRGIRHILLSLRNRFARVARRSPAPMRQFGKVLVSHFDRIADRVDRNTSSIVHRYLDPEISRKADVAVLSRITSLDEASASVIFAKISYDNLKSVIAYLCDRLDHEGHFFVSEALGAVAYGRAAGSFQDTACESTKAAMLLQALLRVGMVRTGSSGNAATSSDADTQKIAQMSVFSAILWLIIERESTPESEDELLIDCCDLALAQAESIYQALEDVQAMADLMAFSRESV